MCLKQTKHMVILNSKTARKRLYIANNVELAQQLMNFWLRFFYDFLFPICIPDLYSGFDMNRSKERKEWGSLEDSEAGEGGLSR